MVPAVGAARRATLWHLVAVAKARDLLRVLRVNGWRLERQAASHRQFRHDSKKGTVTVNGHDGDTLPHWLVGAILKQAGSSKENLR